MVCAQQQTGDGYLEPANYYYPRGEHDAGGGTCTCDGSGHGSFEPDGI